MKFVAYVDVGKGEKAFKVFEVPDTFIVSEKEKGVSAVDAAGWWYMNRCDSTSCISEYEWCIIPYGSFETMCSAIGFSFKNNFFVVI